MSEVRVTAVPPEVTTSRPQGGMSVKVERSGAAFGRALDAALTPRGPDGEAPFEVRARALLARHGAEDGSAAVATGNTADEAAKTTGEKDAAVEQVLPATDGGVADSSAADHDRAVAMLAQLGQPPSLADAQPGVVRTAAATPESLSAVAGMSVANAVSMSVPSGAAPQVGSGTGLTPVTAAPTATIGLAAAADGVTGAPPAPGAAAVALGVTTQVGTDSTLAATSSVASPTATGATADAQVAASAPSNTPASAPAATAAAVVPATSTFGEAPANAQSAPAQATTATTATQAAQGALGQVAGAQSGNVTAVPGGSVEQLLAAPAPTAAPTSGGGASDGTTDSSGNRASQMPVPTAPMPQPGTGQPAFPAAPVTGEDGAPTIPAPPAPVIPGTWGAALDGGPAPESATDVTPDEATPTMPLPIPGSTASTDPDDTGTAPGRTTPIPGATPGTPGATAPTDSEVVPQPPITSPIPVLPPVVTDVDTPVPGPISPLPDEGPAGVATPTTGALTTPPATPQVQQPAPSVRQPEQTTPATTPAARLDTASAVPSPTTVETTPPPERAVGAGVFSGAERVVAATPQAPFQPIGQVSAPPPPAQTGVSTPPPHSQIVSAMGPMLRGPDGSYHMQLNLTPAHLGNVRLILELRGGEVAISMHAIDTNARDLLRDNLGNLRQDLLAMGLKTGNLDVSTGRDESNRQWAEHQGLAGGDARGGSGRSGGQAGRGASTYGDDVTGDAVITPAASGDDAALDVRI